MKIISFGSAVVGVALLAGAFSTSAFAYSQEQEQLCSGDAMRLCSAEIPDVDRVTACMVRNRSQLSEGCKSVFAPAPTAPSYQPVAAKPSKPLNLTPVKTKRPSA